MEAPRIASPLRFKGVVFAMPCCSAFGCRTRETDGKRLFPIPSAKRDAAQRKVWLQRISRADFNPTQWSRLCEPVANERLELLKRGDEPTPRSRVAWLS
ncbi:hypothetical protein HPB49_020143 [Dermacentor silvarum]|uniref:Uncharacterized protein n=1 Tax=Dermacentor silvarum TaxID=543639 RepID=A0ACB8E2R4_DERSI|nr:hypothetical protein HPB49_020143 [Dermacentor silvarum]